MIDYFLLFTPLLLLPVIGLLAFAGCRFEPRQAEVTHVETAVQRQSAGTSSIAAELNKKITGGELLVAVVQWRPLVATDEPSLPAGFTAVNDIPFPWNGMQVKIFTGRNADKTTDLTVTATLPHNSAATWHLCVSAYSLVSEDAPISSPVSLTYTGSTPNTPGVKIGPQDLVYAVAFAADSNGTFPGNDNTLTAGPNCTARSDTSTNPLVEDGKDNNNPNNPFVAQVTNSNPDQNAQGFIFAMGLNVA